MMPYRVTPRDGFPLHTCGPQCTGTAVVSLLAGGMHVLTIDRVGQYLSPRTHKKLSTSVCVVCAAPLDLREATTVQPKARP